MKAFTLFVAAMIISFLSLGNALSLTTYFSTANSFRLRRREYLTASAQSIGSGSGCNLEKKTPVQTQVCKRPAVRRFLAFLGMKISVPPPPPAPIKREFFGAWLSIDPPPTPPPIFSAAA